MYQRRSLNWLKHIDFILIDLICLQIAYVLGCFLANRGIHPYTNVLYRNVAIVLTLMDFIVCIGNNSFKNVLKRGSYNEFVLTLRHVVILIGGTVLYLFLTQRSSIFSRWAFILIFFLYFVITYCARFFRKKYLHRHMNTDKEKRSIFVITTYAAAPEVVESIKSTNYSGYHINGLGIIDEYRIGEIIDGIKIVADQKSLPMYVGQEWIDEVLIVMPEGKVFPQKLLDQLLEIGVTIHMNLLPLSNADGQKQFVEKVGPYTVLTVSLNYASSLQLFLKRAMDILSGIVGCLITLILIVIIGPIIYINSPGPIFFAQERVGRNGKHFKMYKFRSMYLDAEERKAELMKQNRVQDGLMFKLDFDPRIIGNKILPDGTHKTGIGQFIRKTSLDEFPQFFNVLKGDMSLVGTRPPTVDEVAKYDLHHYARLAVKPGITGMWQISGRSDITDFEEVVRLDKEYITTWNPGLDLKILLKTFKVVFEKQGSM